MKTWSFLLPVALLTACPPQTPLSDARAIGPVNRQGFVSSAPAPFDRSQSAGLFAAVRKFEAGYREVSYAPDDVVDLAYTLAFGTQSRLLDPPAIVLALNELPKKKESKDRLAKLQKEGAQTIRATRDSVERALHQQARRVGPNGMYVVALASHGFTSGGAPFVMMANSRFGSPASAIAVNKVQEIASSAQRSLIFVDACRERVQGSTRGIQRRPTPLARLLASRRGQATLYAGTYAYDDHKKQNGVFTAAVLDLLRCKAKGVARGHVTVEALARAVDKRVKQWIKEHQDPNVVLATMSTIGGGAEEMPLASCPPPIQLVEAHVEGDELVAIGEDRSELWRQPVRGKIATAPQIGDLDNDDVNEVVAVFADGRIGLFDIENKATYADAPMKGLTFHKFLIDDLFRKDKRQIVTITHGTRESVLALYENDGALLGSYHQPGRLEGVIVDRESEAKRIRMLIAWGTNNDLPKSIARINEPVSTLFMLRADRVRGEAPPYLRQGVSGSHLWYGFVPQGIRSVETRYYDDDRLRDIVVSTPGGGFICLDFEGNVVTQKNATFMRVTARR